MHTIRCIVVFLLSMAVVLVLAPTAMAQDVTFFAGGIMPGNVKVDNVTRVLDNGPVFGFRISTGFAVFLKVEHTLAFSNDFLFPQDDTGVTRARGFLFNSNLLAQPPSKKIVPYVTVGLGFIRQYGAENLPVGTKFAVNYGGGVKLPKMLGPLGLRFDARGYTARGIFSRSLNMFEVTGGLLLSF